jgi:hypothetical protein
LQSPVNHCTEDALITKWGWAKKGTAETQNAYQELTARLDSNWVETWTEQADRASVEGGASRKIYNVDIEHGAVILTSGFKPITDTVLFCSSEPSMADICLQLAETESDTRNMSGSVTWLAEGPNIESPSRSFVPGVLAILLMHKVGWACKNISQP